MSTAYNHLAGQPLTAREVCVLALVANGHENESIGKTLHISTHTVKSHLQRIAHKLRTTTRAQAVGVAIATKQLAPREIAVPVPVITPTAA